MTDDRDYEEYVYVPNPKGKPRHHSCRTEGLPRLLRWNEIPPGASRDYPLTVGGPVDMSDGAIVRCSQCSAWHLLRSTTMGEYGAVWLPHWQRLFWWYPFDWPALLRARRAARHHVAHIDPRSDRRPEEHP